MRFFYLKLGKGNSLAVSWLAGNNPLGRPAAVIFFGPCTIDDIRNGRTDSQAKNFYESSLVEDQNKTVMVVIGQGQAWFLRSAGELIEHEDPSDSENLWKIMPVEIISHKSLDQIPPVLAGINANTFLSQGTYREIKSWGNIKAIHCALGIDLPSEHTKDENCDMRHLLECLGSVELETLVAKLFEAAGCFVPAYRGGCIQDVDLFAHNYRAVDIELDGLVVPAGERISIQVKGTSRLSACPDAVGCLIALGAPQSPRCFGENWLFRRVASFPEVAEWLKLSLSWLPQNFVERCLSKATI